MSTQVVTVTNFVNVSGNSTRLHFASMVNYDGFQSISVIMNGDSGLQWNFVGYNSNDYMVVDKYWYNSGYELSLVDVPYMDEVVKWELWVRYAGSGNITPLAVSSAVCSLISESSGWYVDDNGINNTEFLDDVPYLTEPFPVSIWRCDTAVDGGMAYIPLFPDAVRIDPQPVPQLPYIMVYGVQTSQAQLETQTNNGLAILTPSSCEETEELCGMWSVNLEHPIDPEGRYRLLVAGNLIRSDGQLFTIKQTEEVWEGSTGHVSVYAEHVFYQLNDEWILATPDTQYGDGRVQIHAKTCKSAIGQIMDALTRLVLIPGGVRYGFTGTSNIDYSPNTYYLMLQEGTSPVDLILGERGVIAQMGGELHRDNFNFSIETRKEGSEDNAFDIRIGKNLRGIRRTIDTTTMCTIYQLLDRDTGAVNMVGWDTQQAFANMWQLYLPHHVVRSDQVSYPADTDFRYERLSQEMMATFNQNCMPLICYEIDMEDVRNNPDFSMVLNTESIRCGDIGRVYDYRLGGTIMLEITQTTYDRVTGKCTSFVVGVKQSFVYHPNHPVIWNENGEPFKPHVYGGELWVSDITGRYLYDSTGRKITMNTTEVE